jgi:hypothetical protein
MRTPVNEDGSFGDGTFNATPLVEAADTGPFFHTDTSIVGASAHNTASATTIEEAVAFYDTPAFNLSPAGVTAPVDLTADEIDDIGRFLRVVNASFNAQMALSRLDAAYSIASRHGNDHYAVQRRLLELARVEIDDALDVLLGSPNLSADAVAALMSSLRHLDYAIGETRVGDRRSETARARTDAANATAMLGTGIDFIIGDGTVMF